MAYENLFTGRLVLFENNDKKSEKSPDFGGNIEFTLPDAMALAEWVTGQEGEESVISISTYPSSLTRTS